MPIGLNTPFPDKDRRRQAWKKTGCRLTLLKIHEKLPLAGWKPAPHDVVFLPASRCSRLGGLVEVQLKIIVKLKLDEN